MITRKIRVAQKNVVKEKLLEIKRSNYKVRYIYFPDSYWGSYSIITKLNSVAAVVAPGTVVARWIIWVTEFSWVARQEPDFLFSPM